MVSPITRRATWVLVALLSSSSACGEGPRPTPTLTTVTPGRGYTDRALRLRLSGAELVPAYDFDLSGGPSRVGDLTGFSGYVGSLRGLVSLRDFTWLGVNELTATLDPGLPVGAHDVVLVDPRGRQTRLPGGFVALGADVDPPRVVFEAPALDVQVAPGSHLSARLLASDDELLDTVTWTAGVALRQLDQGKCAVGSGATSVLCAIELDIPDDLSAGQQLDLGVMAVDKAPAPNSTSVTRSFLLRPPAQLISVDPARGGTAGGTEVVVRGSGLLPGTRIYFGRAMLLPDGGIHLDDGTITGRTPPNALGVASLRAETVLGEARLLSAFEYLSPPTLKAIEPNSGPAATELLVHGENFTAATRLFIGLSLTSAMPLDAQEMIDAYEIRGAVPAGMGKASIYAVDPAAGWTSLPSAYTWTADPPAP